MATLHGLINCSGGRLLGRPTVHSSRDGSCGNCWNRCSASVTNAPIKKTLAQHTYVQLDGRESTWRSSTAQYALRNGIAFHQNCNLHLGLTGRPTEVKSIATYICLSSLTDNSKRKYTQGIQGPILGYRNPEIVTGYLLQIPAVSACCNIGGNELACSMLPFRCRHAQMSSIFACLISNPLTKSLIIP